MFGRIISVLIGYVFGCFLTAELVAARFAGKSSDELGGSKNPGMAHIMSSLGFVPGILTLLGDLLKVVLAALLSLLLFHRAGHIVVLYAGLGCTLGHDFPFWREYRGGKGVATTSMTIVLYAFWPGLLANIIGMLAVFVTQYLCIGGPCIPLAFTIFMLAGGSFEAALISAVLTALSFYRHAGQIRGIHEGTTEKTDVPGAIRKHL